ncbi:GPI ethanolamine phosphate transferase 2 isoform X4 [Elephas maximus indicus]|uniref:GPI ethanolamine phosphate transferase 2 isoform X4 n=1 Tax=Elephas maximus indicus TaxID=99487 RepID=UPI002116AF42|nr:GPI ethanolamine phosphate transferase 2 isoform X4 [Elephas maximus indicus]
MRLGAGTFAACCVAIEVLGVAIFLRGFFPAPVRSSSTTEHRAESPAPEPSAGASSNWTKLPPPLFGKVVIMLIDALRDDFVFGSKGVKFMPYVTYLVERGASHSFVAEAKPPTVTMPRIKALMTGSIPGFVDVIRNLNSPVLLEDNVLRQAKAAGKRVIFYGDETWVKLFPKHFVEYDGTTSFFVSDYTEVDNNVTRHLEKVLKREDWDLLILHYLGLDHIGHLSGPNSPLIGQKLSEMDGVLMKIHMALLSKEKEALLPSLLVLCGDHGMSETGSHGASSTEEVNTALVLISSAFERKPDPGFEQFKMSERLHGNWIKRYLEENSSEVLLNLGSKVLRQYLDALQTLSLSLSRQVVQYDIYSMAVGATLVLEVLALLLLSIPKALSPAAELDVPLSSPLFSLLFYLTILVLSAIHVVVCTSTESTCYFCSMPWLAAGGAMLLMSALLCAIVSALTKTVVSAKRVGKNPAPPSVRWSELDLLILLGTMGHILSLGASSFIEEEHQTWYFLVSTLCLALCQEVCRNHFLGSDGDPQCGLREEPGPEGAMLTMQDGAEGCAALEEDRTRAAASAFERLGSMEQRMVLASPWAVLCCCRLLRALNQTGVQGAHRPDLGHWLTSSDHKAALSVLAALSLLAVFLLVQRRCSPMSKVALALGLLGVYCYRAAIGNVMSPWQRGNNDISKGIVEARFVYVFVFGILFTGTKDLLRSQVAAIAIKARTVGLWEIYSGLVLLAALLLRPHNLPVLVSSLLVQTLMAKFVWKPLNHGVAEVTVMHYWFGQAFFYFQGNSNNIATVDVSAGFVGLERYVEVPAVFLTAFATYVGPVLWASHLVNYLSSESSSHSALRHACFCYALICSIPVSAYIILVTSLRYHLFIWSVFSPKLLYEGMHLFVTAAICVFFTAMDQTRLTKP